jgi:ABC-type Fe3+-siderophore transport system, permease component
LGVAIFELLKLDLPIYVPSLAFSLPVSASIIFLSSRVDPWVLPVVGVGLGTFFSSLAIMFFILAGIESSKTLYALWGSLGRFFSHSDIPIILFILISTLLLSSTLFIKNKDLDAMSLGDLEALCLGYDPKKITVFSTVISSFIVSIITSYVGIIGFVGIMAPHILGVFGIREGLRFYFFSGIVGASLVLFSDSFGRLIFGIDPPIGVIMGIMGAPFLVYLLLRKVNSSL